ncbi:MAG: hypothetical protein ABIZ07_12115 [Dermatophilaceae bacterium]
MVDIVDLRAVTEWASVPIPGSEPPVRLHRLHVDPVSKASLSLVDFPAGWRRPGTGHYLCAEEFVVLGGQLTVSGVVHGIGDHVYLPAQFPRVDSGTEQGCRALAWFSAPPAWRTGEGTSPCERSRVGPPRLADPPTEPSGAGPRVSLHQQVPRVASVDRDVLEVATSRWWFVPAHQASIPSRGPALVRAWPPLAESSER